MTASIVTSCAHDRLTRDTDPDYGYCLRCHHTVFVGTIPEITLLYTKEQPKPEYKCIDCGEPVSSRDTKRCRKCLGKSREGDPRWAHKKGSQAFGHAPIGRQPLQTRTFLVSPVVRTERRRKGQTL